MERLPGLKIQTWNAPSKEKKFSDTWERIRTETKVMQLNEIKRNHSTAEKGVYK